jgi:ribonuclease HI
MYNKPIEYVQEAKYLGVIFDSKLTFKQHINTKFNKAKRLLFSAKAVTGEFWGPSPTLTKWLYTNIVRPTFTYGCLAWGHKTRSKTFANKAKRLQRLGLKSLGPIRTHSPTSGLEIVTYTPPLEHYIKGEIIAAYRRVLPKYEPDQIYKTKNTLNSHLAWAAHLADEAGLTNIPGDQIEPYFHWNHDWSVDLTEYNPLVESAPDKLQIYTDGSHIKTQPNIGVTGAGYVILRLDIETGNFIPIEQKSIYLGSLATIFQAEMYAIQQACIYMSDNQKTLPRYGRIDIISDSKSALSTLLKNVTTSTLVKNTILELDKLNKQTPTKLHWIKAHRGYDGNEMADQLAKKGTTMVDYQTEPIIPVAKSWADKKIKRYIHKEWTNSWRLLPEARQTKIFFPEPHKTKSKKLMAYNRENFAELFRWISVIAFTDITTQLQGQQNFLTPLAEPAAFTLKKQVTYSQNAQPLAT